MNGLSSTGSGLSRSLGPVAVAPETGSLRYAHSLALGRALGSAGAGSYTGSCASIRCVLERDLARRVLERCKGRLVTLRERHTAGWSLVRLATELRCIQRKRSGQEEHDRVYRERETASHARYILDGSRRDVRIRGRVTANRRQDPGVESQRIGLHTVSDAGAGECPEPDGLRAEV